MAHPKDRICWSCKHHHKQTNCNMLVPFEYLVKTSSYLIMLDDVIVFFSYDCSACKELSDNKFVADKLIFVNVDYNKRIPTDVYQLIPSKELEVFYIPYIVRIDSNYTIIEEYKLYEIQDLIKNKVLL